MTMSRWKVMAGVLGVSLGGLAAVAGPCPKPSPTQTSRAADGPVAGETPKVPPGGSSAPKQAVPTAPIDVPPLSPPSQLPPLPPSAGSEALPLPLPAAASKPAKPLALPEMPVAGKKPIEAPKPDAMPTGGVIPVGALLPPTPASEVKVPAAPPTAPVPLTPPQGTEPVLPTAPLTPAGALTPGPTPPMPADLPPASPSKPADLVPPPSKPSPASPGAKEIQPTAPPVVVPPMPQEVIPDLSVPIGSSPARTPNVVTPVTTPVVPTTTVTTAAATTPATKFKIVLRVGEGEPLFEVRHGDDLVMKVLCEKVDIKSPEKGQGLSAVTATGKVRFVGFGAEGTCDSFSFLAGTGEVLMTGNVKVQVKDKIGRVESELTTDKMQYRLDTSAMPGTLKP